MLPMMIAKMTSGGSRSTMRLSRTESASTTSCCCTHCGLILAISTMVAMNSRVMTMPGTTAAA